MDVKKLYDDYEAYIIEMRRWFHRHPELSQGTEHSPQDSGGASGHGNSL